MNPDSENFDSLRRLLALKRHEQPPPGYYNRFSRDVMARIKAGESGGEMGLEPAWIQRVLGMFELKPVFAGAFGMAVCTLLISGVVSSESVPSVATTETPESSRASFVADSRPPTATDVSFTPANTNPVVSLFDTYQPQVQTAPAAAYWIRNGNN
jgi:hypothetical protein